MAEIPTHITGYIEGIQLGTSTYPINAGKLEGHNYNDITAMISASFDALVSTDASSTPYGVTWQSGSTTIVGTLTASDADKNTIYFVPSSIAEAGTYIEYLSISVGGVYTWEQIGSTTTDLTNYVQKATITLSGSSSTPTSNQTSSAGGISVDTSNNGSHTHSIGSLTSSITYVGSSVTQLTGDSVVNTSLSGAHSHSVTTASHSHTVNLSFSTITYVTGITGGSVSDHSHTYDKASLNGDQTFLTSATGTFLGNATITNGVLSWSTATISTNNGTVGITYTSTNSGNAGSHTISATTASLSNVTAATLDTVAPDGVAAEAGSHSHSISSVISHSHNLSQTSATIIISIDSQTGSSGSHTHNITVSSHTHSLSNHTHTISVSGNNYN